MKTLYTPSVGQRVMVTERVSRMCNTSYITPLPRLDDCSTLSQTTSSRMRDVPPDTCDTGPSCLYVNTASNEYINPRRHSFLSFSCFRIRPQASQPPLLRPSTSQTASLHRPPITRFPLHVRVPRTAVTTERLPGVSEKIWNDGRHVHLLQAHGPMSGPRRITNQKHPSHSMQWDSRAMPKR